MKKKVQNKPKETKPKYIFRTNITLFEKKTCSTCVFISILLFILPTLPFRKKHVLHVFLNPVEFKSIKFLKFRVQLFIHVFTFQYLYCIYLVQNNLILNSQSKFYDGFLFLFSNYNRHNLLDIIHQRIFILNLYLLSIQKDPICWV